MLGATELAGVHVQSLMPGGRRTFGKAFAEIVRQWHLPEEGARKRWARAIPTVQGKVLRPDKLPSQ